MSCSWLHNQEDQRIFFKKVTFFGGRGPILKIRFFAVEAVFLDKISKFSVCDLLFVGLTGRSNDFAKLTFLKGRARFSAKIYSFYRSCISESNGL